MTTLHVQTPTGLKPVKAYMYRSSTSKVGLCCTVNQAKDAAFSAMVAAQGTGWLRFDAFWAGIETAQGVYNWADLDAAINQTVASGMKPLVIIQTTPQWVSGNSEWTMGPVTASARTAYANFCRTLALRYMEKLGAIEIWNEANLRMFWKPTPSVADYIALARPAVAAIRSVLPTVPIISHGIGGAGAAPDIGHVAWLDAFYSQGGHLKTPGTPAAGLLFDGIGLHAYEAETSGIGWGMERVRERMVSYSSPQPIWLTECGAPTAPPGSLADGWTVTEAKQAELVAATLTDFAQRSPQGICTLYSAKDRKSVNPGSREDVFGLWKSDNTPKPAVAVYASAARKSRLVPLAQAPTVVSPPPATPTGKLAVASSGSYLVDDAGRRTDLVGMHLSVPSLNNHGGDAHGHAADLRARFPKVNAVYLDMGMLSLPAGTAADSWWPGTSRRETVTYNDESLMEYRRDIVRLIDEYTAAGYYVIPTARDLMLGQWDNAQGKEVNHGFLLTHENGTYFNNLIAEWAWLAGRYQNNPRFIPNPHCEPPYTGDAWIQAHEPVITAIRAAGYTGPIILDPPVAGQDVPDQFNPSGEQLVDLVARMTIPKTGFINGLHWYAWPEFMKSRAAALAYIAESAAAGMPVVLGEFGCVTVGSWALSATNDPVWYNSTQLAFDLIEDGSIAGGIWWHGHHQSDSFSLTADGTPFWNGTSGNLTWAGQRLNTAASARN